MASVLITAVALPHNQAGYNLTDSADFSTLVAGAGNGVRFAWTDSLLVVLKNDTAGAAVFTLKLPVPAAISAYGGTITNPTNSVAAAKTELMRLDSQFRDANAEVTIECDVAAKVLVLSL